MTTPRTRSRSGALCQPIGCAFLVATLTSVAGCGSSPVRGAAGGGGKDPCAKIAAATRAAVEAVYTYPGDDASVDDVLAALGPYGQCQGPSKAGRWAIELEAGHLDLQSNPIEDYETGASLGSSVTVRVSQGVPVLILPGGKRIVGTAMELPTLDRLLGPDGEDYVPMYPYSPKFVTIDTDTDWSGDGVPELIIEGDFELMVLQVVGDRIVPYAPSQVLPQATGVVDFDKDGRHDLEDAAFFFFNYNGDGDETRPFRLVAHGLPGGTFTTDDAATRAYYREACEGLGRSPWLMGRESDASLVNIACAWLHGTPSETILAGVAAEAKALPEDYTDGGDYNRILAEQVDDIAVWLDRARPISIGRDDGRRVVPIAGVKAVSSEAAWQGYQFDAALVADGDLGTSWQPKKGKAPWIEIGFAEPTRVSAIEIGNGFQREDALGDLFPMNRRATRVTVTPEGGAPVQLALDADTRGYQLLVLPAPVVTKSLRVTIDEHAEGSRWKNVALSELRALTGP